MKWIKYTIRTTTEAEDFLSIMLDEIGVEGIEIENNTPLTESEQSDMFIDFLPELPPDNGESMVSFYLDAGEDHEELLEKVRNGIEEQRQFVNLGEGTISVSETEDLDWINNWKQYFHSFYIDDLLIKPTWEELEEKDQDKCVIEIDPGISFGTGKHETTQLCIRQLMKYTRNCKTAESPEVLDLGCGSGILSIVALKTGAGHVVGTDLDENCIVSTRENMEVNHLDASLGDFYIGNLIGDEAFQKKVGTGIYDIVVANILADVIIPMAPAVPDRLKPGGIFITSGIIDFKEEAVVEAIKESGLEILEINHQGEWVNVTAKKPA